MKRTRQDEGELVVDKSIEHVRAEAQRQSRYHLCECCLDRRCLNDSICRTFVIMTDLIAWEILAKGWEQN